MAKVEANSESAAQEAPRFSWPMRFFLGFMLVHIVAQSILCLPPSGEWTSELGMERFPKRLPTVDEFAELRGKATAANPTPVADRLWQTLDSLWVYFKPWPAKQVRAKLNTWEAKGKYTLCWVVNRLYFFEKLVGVDQRWVMYGPDLYKKVELPRLRLLFADGTIRDVRLLADPPDLTNFSRWFQEKRLDCEIFFFDDWYGRRGYCNYLAHQFPRNKNGAKIEKIFVYKIVYRFPAPGESAERVLRAQNGPPNWDNEGPVYVYIVAKRDFHVLGNSERTSMQRQLSAAPRAF